MQNDSLIEELPKGLIQWYQFEKGAKALFVSGGEPSCHVFPEAMEACGLQVDDIHYTALEGFAKKAKEASNPDYDYIILAGVIERCKEPQALLLLLHGLLNPKGRLLIGADNRLGIRYFCGDRDIFSERSFDGIEDYIRLSQLDWKRVSGRAYSKAELTKMLEGAGFHNYRFYSVLPEWTRPQALYAEDCVPEGKPQEQVVPQYHSPDTIFLEEEKLYQTLIENGLFHVLANGFFIECPLDGTFSNAKQVTLSVESGKEEGLATIIRRDNLVEKKALYQEGKGKERRMLEYTSDLKCRGLNVVECRLESGSLLMPYVTGELAVDHFRRLICQDKEEFLRELDRFWEMLQQSSDPVPYEDVDWERFDPDWKKRKLNDPGKDKWRNLAFGNEEEKRNLGTIVKKGYWNLDCHHCFLIERSFVFFNQGICIEKLPLHVLLMKALDSIYWEQVWINALITKEELMERYHLKEHEKLWHLYLGRLHETLYNDKDLLEYHQQRHRDWRIVAANRHRMSYSENEYERVFKDIFNGTQGRKLYLFGSGIFASKFLEQFGSDYKVEGILDNNPKRWGSYLEEIPILSPECLRSMPKDSYKIIICIKNCVPIMRQLKEEYGIQNYSVYDSRQEYPRKLPAMVMQAGQETEPKKYHIGYIAGVFDLFHIGHLNMFKRAKEQCDYLIVGVVTDESVMNNKKTMPCMSFEERIELVRACRYVDEAVELPTYNGDTDEAHRRYHFDVQFSGSDYAKDPEWLAKKAYLEKRGAEMVFFPYTQTTSSTKIKELIERKLV